MSASTVDTDTAGAGVALHPEAVDGESATLRWVTRAADALGFVGAPAGVPAPLSDLLAEGVLTAVAVEPGAVLTTLGAGRAWAAEGAAVRSALSAALGRPGEWVAPAGASRDDVLAAVVQQVLAGEVGQYARSHGGAITLVRAADDAAEVALSGACTHCPAAGLTLDQRVESAVRAGYPALRSLTATAAAPPPGALPAGRRRLGLLPLRRGAGPAAPVERRRPTTR